jgi:hypothetical protein
MAPHNRKKAWAGIAFVMATAGCATHQPGFLKGKYISTDEPDIMVFRADGAFGYKFGAKFDFFSGDNLPPNRARYRMVNGRVEVFDLPSAEPPFTLEIRDQGRSLLLTRQRAGTLPDKVIFHAE